MSKLNANIPALHCYVRKEFLHNGDEKYKGQFEECYVFGITSIKNWAVSFTIMTERGGQFTRIPLHALVHKKEASEIPLDYLELWDCFSYQVAVIQYDLLKEIRCRVLLKDNSMHYGSYLFTLDWYAADKDYVDTSFAEVPEGHKTAHMIKLDSGHFALQPNNRIFWSHPDFIVNPFKEGEKLDYKTNTHKWVCENNPKWATEDSDQFFYKLQTTK